MCGIAGLWEFSKADVEECIIVSMVDALRHRGPDGHGFWRDKNVALGQTRLSIIDLTPSGRQPMISSDGRYILMLFPVTIMRRQKSNHEMEHWSGCELHEFLAHAVRAA